MSIYPAGDRTVLLASPRSFCAGVERAVTALAPFGSVRVVEREITRENLRFSLPPVVRRS
jgi:hypothetical protein